MTSRIDELQKNIEDIDTRIAEAKRSGSNQLAKRLLCRRSGYEAELAAALNKHFVAYVPAKSKRAWERKALGVAVVVCSAAFWTWMVWSLWQMDL